MRLTLFWRSCLIFLAVLLAILLGLHSYVPRTLWFLCFSVLLLAVVAVAVVSIHTSRRIRELQEFSRRVAGGDFRPLVTRDADDDLGELAQALNETAARLGESIRLLTDERNRSTAILGSMIEGVAVISAQERVLYSNRAFSQILGLDAGQIEGRSLIEVVRQSDLLAVIRAALTRHEQISSEIVVGTVRPRSFCGHRNAGARRTAPRRGAGDARDHRSAAA